MFRFILSAVIMTTLFSLAQTKFNESKADAAYKEPVKESITKLEVPADLVDSLKQIAAGMANKKIPMVTVAANEVTKVANPFIASQTFSRPAAADIISFIPVNEGAEAIRCQYPAVGEK